ncbi:MAG: tyrosinase family protein [Oligoflexus sp.]|nr:tyrosinase family protein [Oligoflexus sp.]
MNGCKSVNRPGMPDGSFSSDDAPVAVPSNINIRKSATDPSNAKNMELYRKGVAAMKAIPFPLKIDGADTNWWVAHADIHDKFCSHRNWFFLPWHRGYLHHFEKVIREFCGDPSFALPYWDWSDDRSIPQPFLTGDVASNALFNASRKVTELPDITLQSIKKENIQILIEKPQFATFGGGESHHPRPKSTTDLLGAMGPLEAGPHNNVHATILGDMGDMTSPLDPIFWLHHCNIDRLWSVWAASRTFNNQDSLPSDKKGQVPDAVDKHPELNRDYWLNHKIGGYYSVTKEGDTFKATPAEMTVREVYDAIQLGIAYQPYKSPSPVAPHSPAIVAEVAKPEAGTPKVTGPVTAPVTPPTQAATPPVPASVIATPEPAPPSLTPANAPVIPAPVTIHGIEKRWKAVKKNIAALKARVKKSFGLATVGPVTIAIPASRELNDALIDAALQRKELYDVTLCMTVSNIPFPKAPKAELLFYMNSTSSTGEATSPNFIGSMGFFGHRHGGATVDTIFDLVPTVKKLTKARDFPFDTSGRDFKPLIISAVWKSNQENDDLGGLTISLEHFVIGDPAKTKNPPRI